jgi:hypothetical protein
MSFKFKSIALNVCLVSTPAMAGKSFERPAVVGFNEIANAPDNPLPGAIVPLDSN